MVVKRTIQKYSLYHNILNPYKNRHHQKLINLIVFGFILIFLPELILSDYYIEIKVNNSGNNRILSDSYSGTLPNNIYVNGVSTSLNDKTVNVGSKDYIIKLKWNSRLVNLRYMFYNLNNIIEINMNYIFGRDSSMYYIFYNCINLKKFTYTTSRYDSYSIISMYGMFINCISLTSFKFENLYSNDYDHYINVREMFYNCQNLESISFDGYNLYIDNIYEMFYNCTSLKSIKLNNFRTRTNYFIDFSYMFYNCNNLESITFRSGYLFKVGHMNNMFYNCNSLKSIDLSYFDGNNPNPINMDNLFYNCYNLIKVGATANFFYISSAVQMFYNCTSLTTIDLVNMVTKNNEFIDLTKMFYNCHNLLTINYSSTSGVIGVKNMRDMFFNCSKLVKVDLSNFNSSSNHFLDLSYLFSYCVRLTEIVSFSRYFYVYDIRGMFSGCILLKSIDLGKLRTKENTFISLFKLFYNCQQLEYISFDSNIPYLGVKDIDNMLYNCKRIKEIDFRSWYSSSEFYLNMSRLFYNYDKLIKVLGDFKNLYISDAREMFYGCISLKSLSFSPNITTYGINITKMFYNCQNIENIKFYINSNNNNYITSLYFVPYDMFQVFYNCSRLKSVTLEHFNYSLITNMRGLFQNCKALVSLNLSSFYTPNVEIMFEMFKGCSSLKNLSIPYFDTSKVTDMESMFEGCSSLISLNISHFNTSNVQYMNKMFENCYNLKSLYFRTISTISVSTMHRMFFNCQSLKYLDLFSLVDTGQSLKEMFKGTPLQFELCVKDKENILNIFEILIKENNIERDCSSHCYGDGNERISGNSKKFCCPKYGYNDKCYDECPGRTKIMNIKNQCINFECDNYQYYNYEQNGCINSIPEGYYMNDTKLKTINKCHESCKTCEGDAKNCLLCNTSWPFLYLGNCYNSCKYDYYEENNILKCQCYEEKCYKCSKESLKDGLCITCNKGYYPKYNDPKNKNGFVECYKVPEGYYLDLEIEIYMPCYPSCKYCFGDGNKANHSCISCNLENDYPYAIEDNVSYTNCYPECLFNFYFDDEYNYICLDKPGCPSFAPLLIENSKQCVNSCKNTRKNKYEFRQKCFSSCPIYSEPDLDNSGKLICRVVCPFHLPFEKVKEEICVSSCTIMERYDKLCITNYTKDRFDEIQDMVIADIRSDITDTFNYKFITPERSVIHEEGNINYEITYTNNNSTDPKMAIINLGECETLLKEYYGIEEKEPLYILKIDAFVEGKIGPKVEYEIYYPFNGKDLHQLNISICEGIEIFIGYKVGRLEGDIDLYDRNSPYYNDICYTFTNSNGTDIILEDRQNEFKDLNLSLCEEDCHIASYDINTEIVECSCEVKLSLPFVSQMKIDKSKLYKFMNIKNIVNFKIMICYDVFLSVEGIIHNIGFFSSLPVFVVYLICLFMFYKKDFNLIKAEINKIVFAKKNEQYLEGKIVKINEINPKKRETNFFESFLKKNKINLTTNISIKKSRKKNNIIDNKKEKKNKTMYKQMKKMNKYISNPKDIINEDIYENSDKEDNPKIDTDIDNNNDESNKNIKIINAPPKKTIDLIKNKANKDSDSASGSKNIIFIQKTLGSGQLIKEKFKEKEKLKIIEILKYNDTELNNLGYKKAIKFDKRSYFQYYISLLKTKHSICQIFNTRDYNSFYIKILLVFFSFYLFFSINALFFDDVTMHKIYEDGGEFNFIYQLPQIIYSTIISYIINSITEFLALSQDDILSIKHEKNLKNLSLKAKRVILTLRVKFVVFFVINFILIIVFCYYLGCFCAVYRNTQFHLFKDTLISFGIDSITPFGINLLPGLLRIPSLSKKSHGRRFLYSLSKLLQKF